jgi:hypothetical protein
LERSNRLFVNDGPAAVLREAVVLHQSAPLETITQVELFVRRLLGA